MRVHLFRLTIRIVEGARLERDVVGSGKPTLTKRFLPGIPVVLFTNAINKDRNTRLF